MNDPQSTRTAVAPFELPPVNYPAFSVTSETSGRTVALRLSGNADSDVAPALGTLLERLHEEAVRVGVNEVVLDFRELYFLTSSCIKCLVVAIKRLSTLDARSQYKLRLVTTPALRWQERSFEVLCQMAPLLVRIDRD
jgi:hypothetical protein